MKLFLYCVIIQQISVMSVGHEYLYIYCLTIWYINRHIHIQILKMIQLKLSPISNSPLQISWYDDVTQTHLYCIGWLSCLINEIISFHSMFTDASSSKTITGKNGIEAMATMLISNVLVVALQDCFNLLILLIRFHEKNASVDSTKAYDFRRSACL